ncbi:MAG: response regulator, partial [Alphaproteobacteria bacterium]
MRILIIEDEQKIATLLKKSLEMDGDTATIVNHGDKGLIEAQKNSFDIILLDIMLPKMNGFKITKSLRNQGNKTPIIILTARDTTDDRNKSLEAGADAYIVKPIRNDELRIKIEELTHKKHMTCSTEKITGDAKRSTYSSRKSPIQKNDHYVNEKIDISSLNKNIMDNAPMSIITIDKSGFIISANEYFKNFSKTKKFRNHNVFTSDFFIRENLTDDFRKLFTDGTPVQREKCYEKNSRNEDKYLRIIATPIYNIDGEIDGALSMALDNTEEVISKNKLLDLNTNLEAIIKQRTFELKNANDELSKVSEIKSSFAADVSHEIRTSLTIIQGNLELMSRMNTISKENIDPTNQIYQEISRVSDMLTNLTSLTNADAAQKLTYSTINLEELIENTCNLMKILASEKNITITYKKNTTGAM